MMTVGKTGYSPSGVEHSPGGCRFDSVDCLGEKDNSGGGDGAAGCGGAWAFVNGNPYDNGGFSGKGPFQGGGSFGGGNPFQGGSGRGKGFGSRIKKSGGKVKRTLLIVLAVFVVLLLAGNSFYTIKEEQQAVLSTLGKAKSVTTPGLHFKIPFIQTVQKVNTTIQGFAIGYNSEGDGDKGIMITSDYNFIHIDFYVEYRISDPVKAVYASEDPRLILDNIAQNCIRTTIGSYTVDSVLTTGKNEIQANIKQMILDKLEVYDIGVQLVNITIQDAEPPTEEVSAAFKEVETAKQGKETAVNNANKYRNEQIPQAEAEADKILQDAEAEKQNRINEAIGQVARFNSMYEEYVKYPTITKQRMFYETMEDVLPGLKVIIQGADGSTLHELLPLEPFSQSGMDSSAGSSYAGSEEDSGAAGNREAGEE